MDIELERENASASAVRKLRIEVGDGSGGAADHVPLQKGLHVPSSVECPAERRRIDANDVVSPWRVCSPHHVLAVPAIDGALGVGVEIEDRPLLGPLEIRRAAGRRRLERVRVTLEYLDARRVDDVEIDVGVRIPPEAAAYWRGQPWLVTDGLLVLVPRAPSS